VKSGFLIVAVGILLAGGCAPESGNHRNVELSPQDWVLPGPESEDQYFGPMPYEDVKAFVVRQEREGWSVAGYEPHGHPFDGQYLVRMRRWK
jgi:hypothetical protein